MPYTDLPIKSCQMLFSNIMAKIMKNTKDIYYSNYVNLLTV